jgi:predicted secreted protein
MKASRREWLQLAGAGLLIGGTRLGAAAAPKPSAPPANPSLREALANLSGGQPLQATREILIAAQTSAENRKLFPLAVSSGIKHTEMIAVLVEGHAQPLAARFDFAADAEPYAYFYLRLWESTVLHVVVKSRDGFFTASKAIVVPDSTPCG